MNRLKQWIKRKLGITKLQHEVNVLQTELLLCRDQLKEVKALFQVGVDFRPTGGSWAVVCVGGDRDYIRFAKLPGKEIKTLMRFLAQFPAGHTWIDDINPEVFDLMKGRKG